MPTEKPQESPSQLDAESDSSPHQTISDGHAAYNVVSDIFTGVNVRKSDNKFQAIVIAASVLLLASIGSVLAVLYPHWHLPWYGGTAIGGIAGLILGAFVSGFYLMVYRAVRHFQGKHE